jgi:hypothetical protein
MPEDRDRHDVLVRITETPQLARAVPRLRPEVLHAVIARYGLQDCGDLVALATPQQLSAVFDLDLWKPPRAGASEQFDPARFCEWLEVLVDVDAAMAANRLAHQDVALVVAGLAPAIRVLDPGVFEPIEERSGADAVLNPGRERGVYQEIGGYVVIARRADAWDAIVGVLVALDEHHPAAFRRVMRGCQNLSNAGHEFDGLDELLSQPEQHRLDLDVAREGRRERAGFLPAEQARAFLDAARHVSLSVGPPALDAVFEAYRRTIAAPEETPGGDVSGVLEVLSDAGVIADPRRALPEGTEGTPTVNPALQEYLAHQPGSMDDWIAREQALGFLANALVAGCSVQGRAFVPHEARDAVAATCNLGLECWPRHWGPSLEAGLVTIFRVGWSVLYREISLKTAEALIETLDQIQTSDQELQFDLRVLRRELNRERQAGRPWRVRDRLDVLAPLDLPACTALIALLDECPVMLANVRASGGPPPLTVDPLEVRFVSERRHVAAIHEFVAALAEGLTG